MVVSSSVPSSWKARRTPAAPPAPRPYLRSEMKSKKQDHEMNESIYHEMNESIYVRQSANLQA